MTITDNVHKLKVTTYNYKQCYDVGPKFDFINDFINECDIIFLNRNTVCMRASLVSWPR